MGQQFEKWQEQQEIKKIELRDEFAKAAMQSLITIDYSNKALARDAYDIAELMLIERSKRL
jgi:hypothetical protein